MFQQCPCGCVQILAMGYTPKFAIKEWEYGGKTLELGVPRFQTNPYLVCMLTLSLSMHPDTCQWPLRFLLKLSAALSQPHFLKMQLQDLRCNNFNPNFGGKTSVFVRKPPFSLVSRAW